jgi:hypothetical protein
MKDLTLKRVFIGSNYVVFLVFGEKDLDRALEDIDLDGTLSAADRVADFLEGSLKGTFERYMVARLVSILYEETLACSFKPELEDFIRSLAKKKSE